MQRVLTEIILTVGSNLGLQALLERVCSIIDNTYALGLSNTAVLYVWDPEIERLVIRAGTHLTPLLDGSHGRVDAYSGEYQLRLGEGITGWVAEHRETVVLTREPWTDPRWEPMPGVGEEQYQSGVLLPILLPNHAVLGVISLWARPPNYFSSEHVRVLTEVTALLARLIEKVQLDQELTRRAKVLTFLGDLCQRLASSSPVGELMDSVAALTAQVMASDACLIVTSDGSEGRFVLRGVAPSRAEVMTEVDHRLGGLPERDPDATSDEQLFRQLALTLPGRFEEATSAPLLAGTERLGFISCYRHRRYGAADRDLLGVIAGQVALGLLAVGQADGATERDDAAELLGLLAADRDRPAAVAIAASLGLDLKAPHVLVQARFLPTDTSSAPGEIADRFAGAAKQFIRAIENQNPRSLVRPTAGGVIGLVRIANLAGGSLLQRQIQVGADDIGARLGICVSVGISSPCGGPAEYADAYREAAEALEIGSKLRGEGSVVRFEELGPDLYLFRIAADPRTRRDPWMRALLPLVAYDREKGSGLLSTLEAYLEGRGNASLTAEQLGLHRNTLRQRLTRIAELTGIDLDQTQDWLPLHFAVKLARMGQGDTP